MRRYPLLFALILLAAWTWWPVLERMVRKWISDPDYSHGWLVPVFAVVLFRWRRSRDARPLRAHVLGGWFILLLSGLLRLAGARIYLDWLESASLLVGITGLLVLFAGWNGLRIGWPCLLFLFFMIPLPYRVEVALAKPLQELSARIAGVALRLMGYTALPEGSALVTGELRVEVVKACSGLGTLMVYLALALGLLLIKPRAWLDRGVILLTAVPIALLANGLRVALVVLLWHLGLASWPLERIDMVAGWCMILFALAVLKLELILLDLLFEMEPSAEAQPIPVPSTAPSTASFPSLLGAGLAGLVILMQGLIHGRLAHRWSDSKALEQLTANLDKLPLEIGAWRSRDEPLSPERRELAEIQGALLRRFAHPQGDRVTLLLVCGRPGPISVHTPEVCYGGAGYSMLGEPKRIRLRTPNGEEAELWHADFGRVRSPTPSYLRIFWSWSMGEKWQAPSSPRWTFGNEPALAKMYLIRELSSPKEPLTPQDPCGRLLTDILPTLNDTLFPSDQKTGDSSR